MADTKHSWTDQDLWTMCVCYKENLPIDLALKLTNTKSEKSMRMRYQNCLFLDKGRVEGALSHASKRHEVIWNEVEEYYANLPPKPVNHSAKCRTLLGTVCILVLLNFLKTNMC